MPPSIETINNQMLLNMRERLYHVDMKKSLRLDKTDLMDKDCLDVLPILKQLEEAKLSAVVYLNFSNVDQITDIFFLVLKLNEKKLSLSSLEVIDVCGCRNITDEGIRWLSETESLVLNSIKLKGCKQITQRSICRLLNKRRSLEEINLTATSCAFFPGHLKLMNYVMDVIVAHCPLVSPTKYAYNCCHSLNAFKGTFKDKAVVPYPHHKLLVLHSPSSQSTKGIFTGNPLDCDHGLSIYRGWRDTTETSDFYNVFEVLTGNGTENLVLGNGCIVLLPFMTSDNKTAFSLASLILTVLGQYPENVFVLAALSKEVSPQTMRDKVVSIIQDWTTYVSDSIIYKGESDSRVLTESSFADQMQIVFSQTLLDNLNTLISHSEIISAVSLIEDPKHSYLASSLKNLEKHFPWHTSNFMEEPIESLEKLTKNFCSVLPLVSPILEVIEDVRRSNTSLNGCNEIESAMQILHDRGLCVFFPDVDGKPSIPDITVLPTIANLAGKAPHHAYIQGLGPDIPCWRKDDFTSLNDTIRGHENLLLKVLKKMGLLYRFPCSLRDSEFTDNVLYVLSSDLPDSPYLPSDKVWPDELETGEEQRDCYLTLPAMPSYLLPCFLRKLQEMSKVLLMWRTGLVIRQGPVMILVKLICNQMCHDLPGLVISARVMHNNLRNTLTLTFNNIRTLLEALLQKRKIFAVKSVCCETCNPTKRTQLALSNNCCQVREMDVRVSDKPVVCSKTSAGIVITKETLLPQGLKQSDFIPNHKYMLMMIQGFTKKLSVSPRCYLCNNCSAQGVYCPENLKPGISNRICSCKYTSLCVYCGVCDQCLYQITQAHATVQPSFQLSEEYPDSTAKRVGNEVKFRSGEQYYMPDLLHPEYNNHLIITLNTQNNFIIELDHFSPKSAGFFLKYMTSTGEITLRESEDTLSYNKVSGEIYDQLDFLIVLDETNPFRKKLHIQKNGDFIYGFDLHSLGRTRVNITSQKGGSVLVYTPNLIQKEKIDTKNKENFQDGRVLKCCGPFPTVLERKMSVMWPALEDGLLHNNNGDLYFTGTAGVMLPKQLTWEEVICPSPRLLLKPALYHPLCVANVHNGLELEHNSTWRQQMFLIHLVNAEGYTLPVSDETMDLLIWGWQCLLTHYPFLDLPPVYDKLFPQLPSTGVNDHKAELIGQGVHEIMLLYVMKKLASFGEDFGRDKILGITTTKVGQCHPYNNSGATQLRTLAKDNLTRFGLDIMLRKKRPNYVCLCHAACRSPAGTSGNLTEIPTLIFSGNPNLVTCLKLPGNRLTTIPAETFLNLPHLLNWT
ncbi:uncharacterized protein LOC117323870 [Pecten maximus]|uniref:uncharacterized protein LOC117323870 n=1 Tax=Pecten maximus TaxID=6579 RepID=UPI00145914A1|nr:uncharacterized protein LOC117323870 [Pecten maximus]